MRFCKFLSLSIFRLISLHFITPSTLAANFNIINNCPYTLWAAAKPGGGLRLDQGQTWTINFQPAVGDTGRIWARTSCRFDGTGRGKCQTSDCGGVLECEVDGQPPNTLAEFGQNNSSNMDLIDISLIDGFNVPMEFSSTSSGCTRVIGCTADINGLCPHQLRAPGGCHNPCTVFNTSEYCCNTGNCGPTNYSRFFKDRCPDAYSYTFDDPSSSFQCPSGTNYSVVFCPPARIMKLLLVCDDEDL
ncbi:hypothetical protein Vadar_010485 [Vaccinium darrowii]|uniref:Uncharacterized protein n=1 Tax=Vaccinium darrowii TaxID=229202 RepID=A0ACB7ZAA7_9ERIC|nr:hypothetical protein Vadar_010485 [Vaccinium darrowii]